MIKGILFDMDGVISDTQLVHSQIEREILERFGIVLSSDEITKKYSGVRTRDFFDDLLRTKGVRYDLDVLMDEKWKKTEALTRKNVDEIPGSSELIKMFFENGYSLATVSSSSLSYVQLVLSSLNVIHFFSELVSGDMVQHGKPDPECFLLAASKLHLVPEECLVIEDGLSGMEAARRAHMYCIGLVKNKNEKYPTKNIVLSLSEITNDYLKNLL